MKYVRRFRHAPTISDVASRAGVSPMTVSRVINGAANVRPATRETVNAAIRELNYAPNTAARMLARPGQSRIGVLYSNPSAGYLSEFLVGGLDQASKRDVHLVVEKCDLGDHEIEVAQKLIAAGVDGIILPPPLCDSPELIRLLRAQDVTAVLVGSARPPEALMAVSIDDSGAALAMVRHIISLGHRRIGFIAGNPLLKVSAERLAGYRAALDEAGIAFDPELVAPGLFTFRSGLGAAAQLLSLPDAPTAVFASNDDMAAATVAVAHRNGLDVPGDLTVCGFDDTTLATAIWPELTTIRQPIADMSRAAVEMLVNAIRRPDDDSSGSRHQMLDFVLIRRESDAPPHRQQRAAAQLT